MMPETPDAVVREISRLSDEGEALADSGDIAAALQRFQAAWALLPEPRVECEEAWSLLGAIGDMQFQFGQYSDARATLMTIMKSFDGATGNPFLRLRLGQAMYELGEEKEAASWLAGAYLAEGVHLFDDDDPKYLAFIRTRLDPPPGGWPEGW